MLYPYTLPEINRPDLMIVLDASHAEAFNRAARAAETTMGFLMQSKGILGLLKSPQFYNVGPIDFKNNVVTGAAIEEFGDHLMLNEQKTTITEFRNQQTGYVRAALNDIMEIGRAHDCTPVNNAYIISRLLLEKTKHTEPSYS